MLKNHGYFYTHLRSCALEKKAGANYVKKQWVIYKRLRSYALKKGGANYVKKSWVLL